MLSHGKLASAYLYPNNSAPRRHSAPAGKARQVAGAGQHVRSRRESLHAVEERAARIESQRAQNNTANAIAFMVKQAQRFDELASENGPEAMAYRWIAQAIGADAMRRFVEHGTIKPSHEDNDD